jgi:hypothetical protein
MRGIAARESPVNCPDRGRRALPLPHLKEAVTLLVYAVFLLPSFLFFLLFQTLAAFSATFANARLLKLNFRSSRHFTAMHV